MITDYARTCEHSMKFLGCWTGCGDHAVCVCVCVCYSIDLVGDTVQLAKMARTSIDKVKENARSLSQVSECVCVYGGVKGLVVVRKSI